MQASGDLHHLLLHSTSGLALDRVVNAGSAEGLCAWQLLVERCDPHMRSRTAGQLLSLLQFDFSGDMLAKLEAYERDLALYEQASGEKISDGSCMSGYHRSVANAESWSHMLTRHGRLPHSVSLLHPSELDLRKDTCAGKCSACSEQFGHIRQTHHCCVHARHTTLRGSKLFLNCLFVGRNNN